MQKLSAKFLQQFLLVFGRIQRIVGHLYLGFTRITLVIQAIASAQQERQHAEYL